MRRRDDYSSAYTALEKLGLRRAILSSQDNRVVAPTTTTVGEFTGQDSGVIRDSVKADVKSAFSRLGLASEIFVVVGDNWAWGAATT